MQHELHLQGARPRVESPRGIGAHHWPFVVCHDLSLGEELGQQRRVLAGEREEHLDVPCRRVYLKTL